MTNERSYRFTIIEAGVMTKNGVVFVERTLEQIEDHIRFSTSPIFVVNKMYKGNTPMPSIKIDEIIGYVDDPKLEGNKVTAEFVPLLNIKDEVLEGYTPSIIAMGEHDETLDGKLQITNVADIVCFVMAEDIDNKNG